MLILRAEQLESLATRILEAAGATSETARLVASLLIKANLLGHDSHGIMRLLLYVQQIRDGRLIPTAIPTVRHRSGATFVVDGARGFGQVTAVFAAEQAALLAREYGVGTVGIANANHAGRLGDYVELLAMYNCIGMMMTSGGAPNSNVAPYGGRDGIFGTNPVAWSAPRQPPAPPIIVDYATSSIAAGKLDVALSKGEPIAEGLLLDSDGNPTTDPAAYLSGGVMLPFGGHKGYGLMLMVEIMGRLLTGGALGSDGIYHREAGSWTTIAAWAIEAFISLDQYYGQVEALARQIQQSRPARGVDEVLLPGDPELRTYARRSAGGIPIPETTWDALVVLATELKVPVDVTRDTTDGNRLE